MERVIPRIDIFSRYLVLKVISTQGAQFDILNWVLIFKNTIKDSSNFLANPFLDHGLLPHTHNSVL